MPVGQVKDEFDGVIIGTTATLEATPSNLLHNRRTIAVANTAVALSVASAPVLGVTIKALRTNTADIYVGLSTVTSANGLVLRRGASVSLAFDNLTDVYINGSVVGEGVTYLAVNT